MFFFYILFFFIVFFSLNIILSKKIINSVLSLILIFVFSSFLLLFLGLDYISLIFISIYIGALSVLFLFVIMMLNVKNFSDSTNIFFYILFTVILSLFFSLEYFRTIYDLHLNFDDLFNDFFNVLLKKNIIFTLGSYLFTQFFFYFIFAGFVLFVAMIGSVSLVLEPYNIVKSQSIYQQISRSVNNTYFKVD
jgi:NADH-quinone oxidoreductase subunit J